MFISMIAAMIHVSQSEVQMAYPDYDYSWNSQDSPNNAKLLKCLYDLGLEINFQYEFQEPTQHRNRLGQIVTCGRWYGTERVCGEWIKSGYASKEAIDKSKNSRFLDDLYASKGLTIPVQIAMEIKDRYNNKQEEEV